MRNTAKSFWIRSEPAYDTFVIPHVLVISCPYLKFAVLNDEIHVDERWSAITSSLGRYRQITIKPVFKSQYRLHILKLLERATVVENNLWMLVRFEHFLATRAVVSTGKVRPTFAWDPQTGVFRKLYCV
jgi:hypothetical protein